MSHVRKAQPGFRWDTVDLLEYKATGQRFRDVTRQTLFAAGPGLGGELRYFEIGPAGHSTLERHRHAHAVVVLRGAGQVLVGDEIAAIEPFDLVSVPPGLWHQLRADDAQPLGFLCLVDGDRDRPERPCDADLEILRQDPQIAAFIRV